MWLIRRLRVRTMVFSAVITMFYTMISFLANVTQLDQSSRLPPGISDRRSLLQMTVTESVNQSKDEEYNIPTADDWHETSLLLQTVHPQPVHTGNDSSHTFPKDFKKSHFFHQRQANLLQSTKTDNGGASYIIHEIDDLKQAALSSQTVQHQSYKDLSSGVKLDTLEDGDFNEKVEVLLPQTEEPHLANQDSDAQHSISLADDSNQSSLSQQSSEKLHPANLGSGAKYNISAVDDFIETFLKLDPNIDATPYTLNISEPYNVFLARVNVYNKKGAKLMPFDDTSERPLNSRERFLQGISQYQLYDPLDDDVISDLLRDLSTQPIVATAKVIWGKQFKMNLTFANGGLAIAKPHRGWRESDVPPRIPYYNIMESHIAEIAASYLDRVLGFHRVPPTVGRLLDMKKDIQDLTKYWLAHKFYNSSDGKLCFIGDCEQYCDTLYPICGNPDSLETSVSVMFPSTSEQGQWSEQHPSQRPYDTKHRLLEIDHPWQRTYNISTQAVWETDETYCDTQVRTKSPYNDTGLLLYYMDLAVFDFLIDNMDRHHVGGFSAFWPDTFLLHFDHGRGFARANSDCPTCLAPVRQCCLIRYSTLVKLIKLYRGPDSLSEVMRTALNSDLLAPVLTEPHLDALDRRVAEVLRVIANCIKGGRKWEDVILDDGVV